MTSPSCQWYVTMNACRVRTDATAGALFEEEQKFKSRLLLAGGLGILSGIFNGGGIKGGLASALQAMTFVTTGGASPGPTVGGLGGAIGSFTPFSAVPAAAGAFSCNAIPRPEVCSTQPGCIWNVSVNQCVNGTVGAGGVTCNSISDPNQCNNQPRCQWYASSNVCYSR